MRLDKLLSSLGYGTRKDIEFFARRGYIKYKGEICKDATKKVEHEDVLFDNEPLDHPHGMIIAMNKPKGYICSHEDSGRLIYSLLPDRFASRNPKLSTIGRLDVDTSGIILFSDDGNINHSLTSPKRHIPKVYEVTLKHPLRGDEQKVFASGTLMLNGEEKPLLPAKLEIINDTLVHLSIDEGRYHQVKRMFAAVGNRVEALHRIKFGNIGLEGLEEGEWRYVSMDDVLGSES
ncbi:pseudouridine synthase [Arcobacter sp. FWKO B]|uniref:pseudouridine synthase n=1 Tax=Arcobacter sp. FWKO B TaxID=2593672 RepID=UPI0018A3A17A|nr:pseudouridine synthase [Arcobacter sp. FWKO B]QOG11324.1 pseudouridine synthase [Arcobacter sp. FWKO B]